MLRSLYTADDFDFAVIFIGEWNVYYVFPVSVFINYGSEVHLIETEKASANQSQPTFGKHGN
jgi:PD-(D/E)XK endonuclease